MFQTRANDWVFQSIPASSWKYTAPLGGEKRKDYSEYPLRTATHSESEPYIICHNCQVLFSTDARRRNEKGEWVYVSINNFITYRAALNVYLCILPCADTRTELKKV